MKNSKKFELILVMLICLLLILIGFFGIFVRNNNSYHNIIPEYKLASDLKGATVLEFEVDDSTKTVYFDKSGNEVDDNTVTDENKKDYTQESIPVNQTENLKEENYNKVVEIMKNRLKFLKADQYSLDLDKNTGKIILTFEDEYPDDIETILPMEGKLQLKDSETNKVIIDYTDFDSVNTTYASTDEGYAIYISLKLKSSEAVNKINDYKASVSNDNNENNEKKLKLIFDNENIAEVSIDDLVLTGKSLRITTSDNLTSNSKVQSEMNTNTVVSKLATIGKMPVVYKLSAEEYVKTEAAKAINYIIILIAALCIAISIFFIIKYKTKGLFSVLTFATIISVFLILIRLTKTPISLNAFAGIFGVIALNTILLKNILESIKIKDKTFSENIKKAYLNSIDVIIIALIIFAVLAFSSMTVINSTGLVMFWGWLSVVLGNLIFTVPMLSIVNKEG